MSGASRKNGWQVVDIRTIRNCVQTLIDPGIPVEAERGRYGAYFLRVGYKLPELAPFLTLLANSPARIV